MMKKLTSTEEKIKVMQAYVDGERVEWVHVCSRDWSEDSNPLWNWNDFKYRIMPKAKEMTVEEIEKQLGYSIKVVK